MVDSLIVNDKSFYGMSAADDEEENDLNEIWDSDFTSSMQDAFGGDQDWAAILDSQPVILNDRMITDAIPSPRITHEHSYSMMTMSVDGCDDDDAIDMDDVDSVVDPDRRHIMIGSRSGINHHITRSNSHHSSHQMNGARHHGGIVVSGSPLRDSSLDQDLEAECFPAIPMNSATSHHHHNHHSRHHNNRLGTEIFIKEEPLSAPSSPLSSSELSSTSPTSTTTTLSSLFTNTRQQPQSSTVQQSLLKQPTIILATTRSGATSNGGATSVASTAAGRCVVFPKMNIKVEPMTDSRKGHGFTLPPTPPSSTSSDSEGSLSPIHSGGHLQPSSPTSSLTSTGSSTTAGSVRRSTSAASSSRSSSSSLSNSPLISSQPKGATGVLTLTEEEKRTLLAEGYPIPSRLPLTKTEEKSLKKIRRKIKNKISAQESRRKKKEYMDALEKKVELLSQENSDNRKKVETLESSNKSLLVQLQRLQAMIGDIPAKLSRTVSTQTTATAATVMPRRTTNKAVRVTSSS